MIKGVGLIGQRFARWDASGNDIRMLRGLDPSSAERQSPLGGKHSEDSAEELPELDRDSAPQRWDWGCFTACAHFPAASA
jgi:hypothetical protein